MCPAAGIWNDSVVAVKVISAKRTLHPGDASDHEQQLSMELARHEYESWINANLRHPNIMQLFTSFTVCLDGTSSSSGSSRAEAAGNNQRQHQQQQHQQQQQPEQELEEFQEGRGERVDNACTQQQQQQQQSETALQGTSQDCRASTGAAPAAAAAAAPASSNNVSVAAVAPPAGLLRVQQAISDAVGTAAPPAPAPTSYKWKTHLVMEFCDMGTLQVRAGDW
jgi:hypothetical protein